MKDKFIEHLEEKYGEDIFYNYNFDDFSFFAKVKYPCVYLVNKWTTEGVNADWIGDEVIIDISSIHISKKSLRGNIVYGYNEEEVYKNYQILNNSVRSYKSVDVKKEDIIDMWILNNEDGKS